MPRIVLFRTPAPGDSYTAEFGERGYSVTCVPALDDELDPQSLLPHLDASKWQAVVITSRRAAEVWVKACSLTSTIDWTGVTFYAPGGAVGSVLSQLGQPISPVTAISAAALVPLILGVPAAKPYLLLVGDKSLPTIPNALEAAGREYTRVQVYKTCEAATLRGDIQSLTLRPDDWVALFSPSSAACVRRYLDLEGVKVAAIGETTAEGLPVDAVAQTPDAAGLAAAVVKADEQNRP